jgi:hypothetical protein
MATYEYAQVLACLITLLPHDGSAVQPAKEETEYCGRIFATRNRCLMAADKIYSASGQKFEPVCLPIMYDEHNDFDWSPEKGSN